MLLMKESFHKYFLNTMTQLTLSLDILSLKFFLLSENENIFAWPKNCQKIGVYVYHET